MLLIFLLSVSRRYWWTYWHGSFGLCCWCVATDGVFMSPQNVYMWALTGENLPSLSVPLACCFSFNMPLPSDRCWCSCSAHGCHLDSDSDWLGLFKNYYLFYLKYIILCFLPVHILRLLSCASTPLADIVWIIQSLLYYQNLHNFIK